MPISARNGTDVPILDAAADQRRDAIARAVEATALDLFAVRPMPQVTVGEIAAAAGISVRTLYRYFPTKEHVFACMPRRGAEDVAAHLEVQPPDRPPFEALRDAVRLASEEIDREELHRWMRALATSGAIDRLARMALVTSTDVLVDALGRRMGLPPEDLLVEMAGSMTAGALTVGAKHWALHGGDLPGQILAALDVAGRGLQAL
jgi:AcrR family transcriptional regulator